MKLLYVIILFALLVACHPIRSLTPVPPPIVSEHIIERHDTTIYLPGAMVRDTLPGVVIHSRDSAFFHTEHVRTDATGKAELRYIIDELGRLRIQARCKPDTVRLTQTRERIVERPVEQAHGWAWWQWTLVGLSAGLVLALVVKLALR